MTCFEKRQMTGKETTLNEPGVSPDTRSGQDLNVSTALKNERHRAVGHLHNVCRTTIMSISPEYQRQGLGSILMQHICENMDRHDRYGYVLSSPAGVRLYSKFGFEAVGQVDTPHGPTTSMMRSRQARAF
ncbi:hypothetical protein N658DRAFT_65559 [Parathielavia hyrcaniae]|uniref:N-acetyltransferase domain-containing protein n=1 Tax=Parathielavia hyrcaniae TaxID=113614 RepID=A0AAN6PQD4_9PEZI|nr:hypothetical protein N658DRAFT_65559 [Parathielavia hyrcaniae]